MKAFFSFAARKGTVITSARIALFVGSVLALINHGDRIFVSNGMQAIDWLKVAVTYCVPYCVSTYGAARYALRSENTDKTDDTLRVGEKGRA